MTRVTYRKSKNRFYLKCDGHADYNPGNDIVCSAISALNISLANAMMMEMQKGNLLQCDVSAIDGLITTCVKTREETYEKIELAFEMTYNGLSAMAEQYEDNIIIE